MIKRTCTFAMLMLFGGILQAQVFDDLKQAEEFLSFTYQNQRGVEYDRLYEFHDEYILHTYRESSHDQTHYYKYYYKDLFNKPYNSDFYTTDSVDTNYKRHSIPVKTGYRKTVHKCYAESCEYKFWEIPVKSHDLVFHADDEKKFKVFLSKLKDFSKR